MAGTVIDRSPLGASTTARKWWLDVRMPGATTWLGLFGIGEMKANPATATEQEDSDYDGEGYKSTTVTALTHGVEGKLHRKTQASNQQAYDPGQELLRLASLKMGAGNRVEYRLYEMEPSGPRVEAYQGFASVTWSPDGGSMDALDTVSFALKGQGRLIATAHPEGIAPTPVIASILPSGAAAGAQVVIRGDAFTGLTGATAVKFGATNATGYAVLDDDTIMATVPAGAAGAITVTVGTATRPYTRGA